MVKTPRQGYVAVRSGKGVRECIFLNWETAEEYVSAEQDVAEYAVFNTWPEAEAYLTSWRKQPITHVPNRHLALHTAAFRKRAAPTSPTAAQKKQKLQAQPTDGARPRGIYKNWEANRMKLKAYMATHNGSWEVDRNENLNLSEWVREQLLHLRKLREGKPSQMTEEKYQRLLEIGVDMTVHTWTDRMNQLKEFKAEHNHCIIPTTHEVLGKWASSIRRQAVALGEGKPAKDLNAERLVELRSIGFNPTSDVAKAKKCEDWDEEFEHMFERLRAFKEEHATCKVTKSHEGYTDLFNWVLRIRLEYKKLAKSTDNRRLTAQQLLRLTDIGFVFRQKEPYKSWEARVEELRQHKTRYGSIANISLKHPRLAEFVSRQRADYREWCDGAKTCLTEERIEILESLGIEWKTENWKDKSNSRKAKTWAERFDELLEFKAQHGHTLVPQNMPGLGKWVNAQRVAVKAFLAGEKSQMTAEKALQLSNVGFVVDARNHRKRSTFEDDEVPVASN